MSLTGRFVLLALLGALVVVASPTPGTMLALAGVLVVLAGVDLALAVSPRRITLTRELPESVRLTESVTSGLVLHNPTRRTLRAGVRDGWQPSAGAVDPRHRVSIPGGQSRRLRTTLVPVRRGDRHSPHVTLRSAGPLGLAARQVTVPLPGRLRVLPPFHARRHLPSKLRRLRELDGRAAVQIRGAGTEFDSLRDYVRGDDVRSIDWRATARRQAVVVRTWRPERDRRVVIVLDTSRTAAARIGDEPRLDTGMEAALLLAVLAERGGDRVDFLAVDRRVRARVGSADRGELLPSLVQAMAPLEAELIEADFSRLPGQIANVSAHRSLVVLVTSLDSGAAEEGLLPVLPALCEKHVVVVAAVRDPQLDETAAERGTVSEVYRAAAAERSRLERAAMTAQLRLLGVEVVDEPPALLPPRLADAYIRLKAAGRL